MGGVPALPCTKRETQNQGVFLSLWESWLFSSAYLLIHKLFWSTGSQIFYSLWLPYSQIFYSKSFTTSDQKAFLPEGIPFTVVRTLNAKTNPIFLRTTNMQPHLDSLRLSESFAFTTTLRIYNNHAEIIIDIVNKCLSSIRSNSRRPNILNLGATYWKVCSVDDFRAPELVKVRAKWPRI